MTELVSAPKAQMHWALLGTWNLEKLHLELKYLGRNVADARLTKDRKEYNLVLQQHFISGSSDV